MKSGQPLRPEDKRDIDIAMETKSRAGGFGLGAGDFLCVFMFFILKQPF